MASATNRKLTNEIDSPKNFNSDAKSKYFIRDGTRTIKPISTMFEPIVSVNNLEFTDLKKEKKYMHEYQHWEQIRRPWTMLSRETELPKLFG